MFESRDEPDAALNRLEGAVERRIKNKVYKEYGPKGLSPYTDDRICAIDPEMYILKKTALFWKPSVIVVRREIKEFVIDFGKQATGNAHETLNANEQQAKQEAITYGLPPEET